MLSKSGKGRIQFPQFHASLETAEATKNFDICAVKPFTNISCIPDNDTNTKPV